MPIIHMVIVATVVRGGTRSLQVTEILTLDDG